MDEVRAQILGRLRRNRPAAVVPKREMAPGPGWSLDERVGRFCARQRAVRGEVHRLTSGNWLAWLRDELPARGLTRVLVGQDHERQLPGLAGLPDTDLMVYQRPIEDWKPDLFDRVDVAITGCRAAIAETGSLVLWPDANEPRLMSLVPPVHIALLDAGRIHETFAALIEAEGWAEESRGGMPTNALLISGPSKTADIEQTLAYGIHGPKQLVTLILG